MLLKKEGKRRNASDLPACQLENGENLFFYFGQFKRKGGRGEGDLRTITSVWEEPAASGKHISELKGGKLRLAASDCLSAERSERS